MKPRELDLTTLTAIEVKQEINDWLFYYTDGRVQSGPFKDMRMLEERSWHDGNLSACLLGCYEQELHPAIEEEIARLSAMPYAKIVNLGCAEGYYAVGLARRLPNAGVWIEDIDPMALDMAQKAAALNAVVLHQGSMIESMCGAHLIVCDCEGGEDEYLDPSRFPSLLTANMIVEIHTEALWANRFMETHDVWIVEEGARNPNDFEVLRRWPSIARWTAVSEGRPCTMRWVILKVRRPC